MANTEILQEYLIKLGYKTDLLSLRRFEDSLGGTTKNLLKASTAVTGIVVATGAATAAFAYNMRKMYFASELSGSSVKNLKSVEYASKQVGVANGAMESSIHSLATLIRTQPGISQYIESLGVPVKGRDVSDVATDLISVLAKMPEWQGVKFAEQFGIDPDTFHMLITNLDQYKAKQLEAKKIFDEMGVSFEDNEKVVKEYAGTLDRMELKVEAVSTTLLQKLLPTFSNLGKLIDIGTDKFNNWLKTADSAKNIFSYLEAATTPSMVKEWWDITFGEKKTTDNLGDAVKFLKKEHPEAMEKVGADAEAVMDFFIKKGYSAEQAAGITANLQQESNFNPQAVGDKGKAVGLAQWHSDRQREFKRVFGKDLKDATREEQLEFVHYELTQGSERRAGAKLRKAKTRGEAAATISQFYERPADVEGEKKRRAAMAEKYAAPVGTQTAATMDIIGNTKLTGGLTAGTNINTTNNFNITGTDAKSIGEAVVKKQVDVNENIARNLRVATR